MLRKTRAATPEDFVEQVLLCPEIIPDEGLINPSTGGDIAHPSAIISSTGKGQLGVIQDCIPQVNPVFGATRAAALCCGLLWSGRVGFWLGHVYRDFRGQTFRGKNYGREWRLCLTRCVAQSGALKALTAQQSFCSRPISVTRSSAVSGDRVSSVIFFTCGNACARRSLPASLVVSIYRRRST